MPEVWYVADDDRALFDRHWPLGSEYVHLQHLQYGTLAKSGHL
jgi:hypothetical protein